MKHELLNNLSGVAVLITVTLAFSMLFETRYPRKTYFRSLFPFLALLFAVNLAAIFRMGFAQYGMVTLFIATLPSLIYFYIVSLHRDGRFFFTFCLVDTSAIWLSMVTGLIDYFLGAGGLLNIILRIAAMPIVLFLVYRWVRQPFFGFLHSVQKGWWLFSGLTGLVYLILIMVCSVPTSLRDRPQDIPLAILISIFLPLVYAVIFYMLMSQQKLHDLTCLENSLADQASMMKTRAEEIRSAEDKLRIERHDLRHQLNVIRELTVSGQSAELLDFLDSIQGKLDEAKLVRCCTNPVLDAILSSYFRKAEEAGIQVETHLRIPEQLPTPDAELATVLANALENAIHSCQGLPPERRKIVCTCIDSPTLMLELRNSYEGEIYFDLDGLPVSSQEGHGMGCRSILAFCKKYDATYLCETKDGVFSLMIAL